MFSSALLTLTILSAATAGIAAPLTKRAVSFFNPVAGGGSWLDNAGSGGEPLNVRPLYRYMSFGGRLSIDHITRSLSLA